MYLEIAEVTKLDNRKCCCTCLEWQGRTPNAGKGKICRAAFCELDRGYHEAGDECEDYEPLPGTRVYKREERRKQKKDRVEDELIEVPDGPADVNCEAEEVEVEERPEWDNALVFKATLANENGNRTRCRIAKLSCTALPFLEEEFVAVSKTQTYDTVQAAESAIKKMADGKLKSMGLEADVFVESEIVTEEALIPYVRSGNFINLYVDIGSTNSKWIISKAVAETGLDDGFIEVGSPTSTRQICEEWSFSYDKAAAYKLDDAAFRKWMCNAAYAVMMHFRNEYNADVFFMRWSFPRMVDDRRIDFNRLSGEVTEYLKSRGLLGDFMMSAESDALSEFFCDRLRDLAAANDSEEEANARRAQKAEENRRFNEGERAKHDASLRKRSREAKKWKDEHWFKRWFCDPEYQTEVYDAKYKDETWERSMLMSAFRRTGARADGKFNLLILDAGGSSLDYYYRSSDGRRECSGSYRAGGNDMTKCIMEKFDIDFPTAEKQKKTYYISGVTHGNKAFLEATQKVYKNALLRISNEVGISGAQLCIVGTGLAMLNRQLQHLVEEVFRLPTEQHIIWSPGIVEALPEKMLEEMPKAFQEFDAIVRRRVVGDSGNHQPWPSSDVVGGLYFVPKSSR